MGHPRSIDPRLNVKSKRFSWLSAVLTADCAALSLRWIFLQPVMWWACFTPCGLGLGLGFGLGLTVSTWMLCSRHAHQVWWVADPQSDCNVVTKQHSCMASFLYYRESMNAARYCYMASPSVSVYPSSIVSKRVHKLFPSSGRGMTIFWAPPPFPSGTPPSSGALNTRRVEMFFFAISHRNRRLHRKGYEIRSWLWLTEVMCSLICIYIFICNSPMQVVTTIKT